jgi:hypothetical protein
MSGQTLRSGKLSFSTRVGIVAAVCTILCSVGIASRRNPSLQVVHVGYGITKVQLTRDGVQGVLIRGWRESFNAHGFDVVSIYAVTQSKDEKEPGFLVIPVWDGEKERLELSAGGGADCKLDDFRFVGGPGRDLQLVTAHRELGASYASAAEVTFIHYALEHNTSGEPGRPRYYFESTQSSKAKTPYCDVDEALKQELGLVP